MGGEQDREAEPVDGVGEALHQFGEDRVVDGWHDQPDGAAADAVDGLGGAVADIAQAADGSVDLFPGRRP